MRFLILYIIAIVFSLPVMAQEHGCLSKCLARGGLPEDCNQQCGIVTHGSVGIEDDGLTKSINKKFSNINSQNIDEEAFDKCYLRNCTGKNDSNLPVEECIENCAKIVVLDSSGGTNVPGTSDDDNEDKRENDEFEKINFSCFKSCREDKNSLEECKKLCEE